MINNQNIKYYSCLVGIYQTDDKNKQKERFDQITYLVDLNNIIKLEFDQTIDLTQSYFIEMILL